MKYIYIYIYLIRKYMFCIRICDQISMRIMKLSTVGEKVIVLKRQAEKTVKGLCIGSR